MAQEANQPQQEPCDLGAITSHPLGQLRALISNGMEPALALAMVRASGLQSLIGGPALQGATSDLQTALSLHLTGRPEARVSVICLHPAETGLLGAARAMLADPETWRHPCRAVVICANDAERQGIEALLRQPQPQPEVEEDEDVRWGDDGDPIAAAQATAVRIFGADPARLSPLVLTADEIQEGQS